MSLMQKMLKAGSIKGEILSKSKFFNEKDVVQIDVPILNVAFSGELDGGLVSGLSVIAGLSRSFKSLMCLYCMRAYLNKYPDAVALLLDGEFGITKEYLEANEIDSSRVIHVPIENIEQLKFDLVKRLEQIDRGDKVFIMIDSLGSLSSKKEVDDALDEKSVADMTRAKAIRSLLRIITPQITMKDIPCLIVNHIYTTQEMFSKNVISGGCVVEGTKIIMEDGSLKCIEDIQVNDLVKTLNGGKEVTFIWNPNTLDEGEPECYEIEFEDGYVVTCSDKHKFLIGDNWVQASDLVVGDDVVEI